MSDNSQRRQIYIQTLQYTAIVIIDVRTRKALTLPKS